VRWQLQEAKQRFSEVVRRALEDGPQVVTRRGEDAVVVVSTKEYARLQGDKPDFAAFLLAAPDLGVLDLERSRDMPREGTLEP
jgi:prevent-host-death family protein